LSILSWWNKLSIKKLNDEKQTNKKKKIYQWYTGTPTMNQNEKVPQRTTFNNFNNESNSIKRKKKERRI